MSSRRLSRAALALSLLGAACHGGSGEPGAAASVSSMASAPAVAAATPSATAAASAWPGEGAHGWLVERVVDGDTVLLAGGERVRLLGIDTLEMKHPDPKVHALAVEAREELASMALGRRVRLGQGQDPPGRDKYGRLLAYLELPGDPYTDAGSRLLAKGLARPYPSAHRDAATYRALASLARRKGLGLWRTDVQQALGTLPEADIACVDADSHVGKLVRVRGTVVSPPPRRPTVHVIPLACEGGGSLPLVIFPSRYDEFPEDGQLSGQWGRLEITGRISVHDGRTQMILDDPFQVDPLPPTRP